jgi:hypothetical protein
VEVGNCIEILRELERRKQIPEDEDFRHFAYNKYYKRLFFFNLSYDRDRLIGVQYRTQNPKPGERRFNTFQYSDIWKKILKKEIREDIKEKMDRISLIYNILRIDYFRDIFVFESTIDSHHINENGVRNSVATWSASTSISFKNGLYLLDNDTAGLKTALKYLHNGHKVFLWSKFLEDYPEYNGCKDLNDVFIIKGVDTQILKKYFSDHQLDSVYL